MTSMMATAILTGVFTLLGVLAASSSNHMAEWTKRRRRSREEAATRARQIQLAAGEELMRLQSCGRQLMFDVMTAISGDAPHLDRRRKAAFSTGFNEANEELKLVRVRAEVWQLRRLAEKLDQARPLIQRLNMALFEIQHPALPEGELLAKKSECNTLLDALQDMAIDVARP
jgi:hypothetical protein